MLHTTISIVKTKILNMLRRSSASQVFIHNNVLYFETIIVIRRDIHPFTSRLKHSTKYNIKKLVIKICYLKTISC